MAVQWPLLIFSLLTGASAGMMVFVGIGELAGRFKRVRFLLAVVAFVLLIVGGCASVLHLGHPERALHILGNVNSGLSKELFAVGALAVLTFVYAILAKKEFDGAAKAFGVLALIAGLVLPFVAGMSYMMAARPAWDSITLPLMYLGTGIGMGFALAAALVLAKGEDDDSSFAVKLALAGIVIAAVVSIAYVAWVAMAPYQDDTRSIARLVSGDLAVCFWGGIVVLGIAAPVVLAIAAWKKASVSGGAGTAAACLWAALACTVVGGIALRVAMYLLGTSVQQLIY